MSDELVQRYIGVWNENDSELRKATIAEIFTENAVYSDPEWEAVEGHQALYDLLTQAREKFGTLQFSLGSVINAHHDHALFTWRLGEPGAEPVASGYDAVTFEKGRFLRVHGFFD